MIDMGMFVALGFLVASLLALLLAPPLWKRAVRLTTRRLESTMPMSVSDIQADKDQLRAEFAIELRRVEMALERAKDKAIREQVEANKRRVKISELNAELASAKATLQENENANRVLEQTIKRRLPDMDSRLKAAKDVMVETESVNVELRRTADTQAAALKTARASLQTQRSDIEQLRAALEGGGGKLRGLGKSDAKETQRLSAELSRVKEELERNRVSREENDALRQELNRLATQILAVAKTQGVTLPHVDEASTPRREVRDLAETVASLGRKSTAPEPEPAYYRGNGAEAMMDAVEPEEEARLDPIFSARIDDAPAEIASSENGAGHEAYVTDASPESVPNEAASLEGELVDENETTDEPETTDENEALPKGPLARRLAARRAKRRARKGPPQSLSDRLKDVPAKAPES
jgi:myosin heavy subunit